MLHSSLIGLAWRGASSSCKPALQVFSAVRRAFDHHQRASLSDYLTAVVMMEYNHRQPAPVDPNEAGLFDNVVEHDG